MELRLAVLGLVLSVSFGPDVDDEPADIGPGPSAALDVGGPFGFERSTFTDDEWHHRA